MKHAILDFDIKESLHIVLFDEKIEKFKRYRDAWRFVSGLFDSGEISTLDNKVAPEQSISIKAI